MERESNRSHGLYSGDESYENTAKIVRWAGKASVSFLKNTLIFYLLTNTYIISFNEIVANFILPMIREWMELGYA